MLDTEPLYKVAWQQASTELGYELDDTSYLKLVGRPTPDCEEELIKQFGDGFPLADCSNGGPVHIFHGQIGRDRPHSTVGERPACRRAS